jgi:hypothetical protein
MIHRHTPSACSVRMHRRHDSSACTVSMHRRHAPTVSTCVHGPHRFERTAGLAAAAENAPVSLASAAHAQHPKRQCRPCCGPGQALLWPTVSQSDIALDGTSAQGRALAGAAMAVSVLRRVALRLRWFRFGILHHKHARTHTHARKCAHTQHSTPLIPRCVANRRAPRSRCGRSAYQLDRIKLRVVYGPRSDVRRRLAYPEWLERHGAWCTLSVAHVCLCHLASCNEAPSGARQFACSRRAQCDAVRCLQVLLRTHGLFRHCLLERGLTGPLRCVPVRRVSVIV